MIRPFTLICAMLAAGSGLYLYQVKHQAQLQDRRIRQIQDATATLRERAGVLRANYALLNDPQRLQEYATRYLPVLRPTQPGQWSTMADLPKRLPPVGAPAATVAPLEPDSPVRAEPDETTPVAAVSRPAPAAAPATSPAPAAAASRIGVVQAAPTPKSVARPAVAAAATPAAAPAVLAAAGAGGIVAPAPSAARPAPVQRPQPAPSPAGTPSRLASASPASPIAAPPAAATAAPPAPVVAVTRPVAAATPAPVFTSALGMARTLLHAAPIAPANAAMPYTVGEPQ